MRRPHSVPSPSVQRPGETANDRLKRSWSTWYSGSLVLAVALHFGVFTLWPAMTAADISFERAETAVILPPEIEIPPPPEVLARPATPVVTSAAIDESITIPSTTFENWMPERIAPPAAATRREADTYTVFTPSMIAPRVLNQEEVERALARNYPPLLRDAGIGGRVQVNLWLDEAGRITRAEIAQGSGHAALDEAALRVVDVMRLSPALNRNVATRVIVAVPVVFTARD